MVRGVPLVPKPLTDDPQEDLMPKYQERVERFSQQNRVIEVCIVVAEFLTTILGKV